MAISPIKICVGVWYFNQVVTVHRSYLISRVAGHHIPKQYLLRGKLNTLVKKIFFMTRGV